MHPQQMGLAVKWLQLDIDMSWLFFFAFPSGLGGRCDQPESFLPQSAFGPVISAAHFLMISSSGAF